MSKRAYEIQREIIIKEFQTVTNKEQEEATGDFIYHLKNKDISENYQQEIWTVLHARFNRLQIDLGGIMIFGIGCGVVLVVLGLFVMDSPYSIVGVIVGVVLVIGTLKMADRRLKNDKDFFWQQVRKFAPPVQTYSNTPKIPAFYVPPQNN